jgi:hypothetical protein
MILLYEVDSKPYLSLTSWDEHQQVRAKRSKFPSSDSNGYHVISIDSICHRNPIQSNPIRIQSNSSMQDKPAKLSYGSYKNVFLTENEVADLRKMFPTDLDTRIEEMSLGIASKGYKYQNFAAALKKWAKRENNNATGQIERPAPGRLPTMYTDPKTGQKVNARVETKQTLGENPAL